MSNRLTAALRRKYANSAEAMKALGLDVSLLREGYQPRLAHDVSQQFRQEQYGGWQGNVDDQDNEAESSNPEVAELANFLREEGLDEALIERACRAAMQGKYAAMDSDPIEKLRSYLRDKGMSEDDANEACEHARRDAGLATDDPPDLPHGSEPRPNGSMTPLKLNGSGNSKQELTARPNYGARLAAMDAVRRIQVDHSSIPSQRFDSPQVKLPGRRIWASDSVNASSKVMADTYKRFPGLALIGRA